MADTAPSASSASLSSQVDSPSTSDAGVPNISGLIDVEAELHYLLGPEPFIIELPNTVEGITSVLLNYRKNIVQLLAARLKAVPPRAVSQLEFKKLAAFLNAMYSLELIDPKMK
jgi:hypothetical protein